MSNRPVVHKVQAVQGCASSGNYASSASSTSNTSSASCVSSKSSAKSASRATSATSASSALRIHTAPKELQIKGYWMPRVNENLISKSWWVGCMYIRNIIYIIFILYIYI